MAKTIITGNASPEEAQNYIDYLEGKYNKHVKSIDINLDGEYADLNYEFENVPFERVRRITGYLVGTMDRWNGAKQAEEADRVKHCVYGQSASLGDFDGVVVEESQENLAH